jgi:hypothetical protein
MASLFQRLGANRIALLSIAALLPSAAFADVVYTNPNGLITSVFLPTTRVGTTSNGNASTFVYRSTVPTVSTKVTFSAPASAPFGGGGTSTTFNPGFTLLGGSLKSSNYTFSPTSRGLFTTTATVSATNSSTASRTFNLTARGVGPQYASNDGLGGIIDFGVVHPFSLTTLPFVIDNTGDITAVNIFSIADANTRLTVKKTITGAGFGSTLVDGSTAEVGFLTNQPLITSFLSFLAPYPGGHYTGFFDVFTDEDTTLGNFAGGKKYEYELRAYVTPEPSTYALLGTGLAVLLAASRRRKNNL